VVASHAPEPFASEAELCRRRWKYPRRRQGDRHEPGYGKRL